MQIDRIHFYVDNAQQWRDWFVRRLGFAPVTHVFPNFWLNDAEKSHTCTEVVKSGAIYFVLSSPLSPDSPVFRFLQQHPPGVADVTFKVEDVTTAMEKAIANGAKVLQPIRQHKGFKWGKIAAWGALTHTLVEDCLEENQTRSTLKSSTTPLFTGIDHVVLNVEAGDLEKAVNWYEQVLGFKPQQAFTIQTDRSGLHSQVMIHPDSGVKFPLNQPASANSQIQEFLTMNRGAGVQHIALATQNIIKTVPQLQAAGLEFLSVPATYYTQLKEQYWAHFSSQELEEIARSQILVDGESADSPAFLLQIFTRPIFPQPTFFFEIIERRFQAKGFGEGNFRALFQAIEREQMKRGSLS